VCAHIRKLDTFSPSAPTQALLVMGCPAEAAPPEGVVSCDNRLGCPTRPASPPSDRRCPDRPRPRHPCRRPHPRPVGVQVLPPSSRRKFPTAVSVLLLPPGPG